MIKLPTIIITSALVKLNHGLEFFLNSKTRKYKAAAFFDLLLIILILSMGYQPVTELITPAALSFKSLTPITETKNSKQVFGFAPYWNIDKLENVDFKTLTTLAYFGVEVGPDGNLDKDAIGYETFNSKKATEIFKKAHENGTKVVLTLTQMENGAILSLMDNADAQKTAIEQTVKMVKDRGIDGLNIDLEYAGDPGQDYRDKFSKFVADLTDKMHQEVSNSQVTVSVYASAVRDPKIYDISAISKTSDGIFMMAYDFAVAGSDNAIPTSPLNGHKEGKYWYDVSTAVDDFLAHMSADKLILGVPYYGYNYLVYEPTVKAETRPAYSWRGKPVSQTYSTVQEKFQTDAIEGVDEVRRGWDEHGKVGYVAYHIAESDTWRMVFMEDSKSLALKYDFAKSRGLGGVGMWALGNDDGKSELWALLKEKFGVKTLADNSEQRQVVEIREP